MKHPKAKRPVSRAERLLADIVPFAKDVKNYDKIERALLDTLACHTSHSDPSKMFDCKKCQGNAQERRELMKKFGFYTSAHYYAWKKIMNYILNPPKPKPLPKYDDKPQSTDTGTEQAGTDKDSTK